MPGEGQAVMHGNRHRNSGVPTPSTQERHTCQCCLAISCRVSSASGKPPGSSVAMQKFLHGRRRIVGEPFGSTSLGNLWGHPSIASPG